MFMKTSAPFESSAQSVVTPPYNHKQSVSKGLSHHKHLQNACVLVQLEAIRGLLGVHLSLFGVYLRPLAELEEHNRGQKGGC